jgi:hypothetical protein
MIRASKRDVIGDVRFALGNRLRDQYPKMDGNRGFLRTTEAYQVKTLLSINWRDLDADYYIAPGDGGGPIMVEVGEPNKVKWEAVTVKDGKPARVLTIGYDGLIDLSHPRGMPFESDLLAVLQEALGHS